MKRGAGERVHIYLYDKDQIGKGEDAIRNCSIEYIRDMQMEIPAHVLESARIFRSPAGKPFFMDLSEIHFSVSHSGSVWGCAIDDAPIGFDLEDMDRIKRNSDQAPEMDIDERWQKIAKRFFSPEEYEFVRRGGKKAFFRLWVRKEAYVKYKGLKLIQEISKVNMVAGEDLISELPDGYVEEINLGPKLIGAYCAAEKKKIRGIKDFRNK